MVDVEPFSLFGYFVFFFCLLQLDISLPSFIFLLVLSGTVSDSVKAWEQESGEYPFVWKRRNLHSISNASGDI